MTKRRAIARTALLLLAALAAGCSRSGTLHSEERPARSDEITDFKILYGRNCAGCHGADGRFGPAPPLNDPVFLAIVPDDVLLGIVADGRSGTPMPAFSRKRGGTLTDKQVEALARGIKTRWKAKRPKVPPPDYLVAEQSSGDPARGRRVFEKACATCHGDEGRGGKEKVGPINDGAFLALISDQAVRRTIITGRPDLEMPNFAESDGRASDFRPLSPADVADLVALLADWRQTPAAGRAQAAARLERLTKLSPVPKGSWRGSLPQRPPPIPDPPQSPLGKGGR